MSRVVLGVVGLGYLLVCCLSVMILTGWQGPGEQLQGAAAMNPLMRPVTLTSLALIAVAATLAAARSKGWTRWSLSALVVLLAMFAFGLVALQGRARAVVGVSLVIATAAQFLRLGSPARELMRCVLAGGPFFVAGVITPLAGVVSSSLASQGLEQLVGSAAIGLSLAVILGVASSVEEWRERADSWMSWNITPGWTLLIILFKVSLLIGFYLRLTGDLLGGESFWRPRLDQPLSWLHALLVGGLIVSVAVRSRARPITAGGFTARLFVIVAVLAVMQTFALFAAGSTWVALAIASPGDWTGMLRAAVWVIDHKEPIQFWAVALLTILAFCQWRLRGRLTSGLYFSLVAGLWLLPPLAGMLFAANSTLTFWAAPGQVDTVITLLALGLYCLARVRRRIDTPRTLAGLVLIPIVVLHLENLWSSDWADWLPSILAVSPTFLVLFIDPPRVSGDVLRVERSRLLAVAGHTALILAYWWLIGDADLFRGLETSAVLASLWLGVPIVAILVARLQRPAHH